MPARNILRRGGGHSGHDNSGRFPPEATSLAAGDARPAAAEEPCARSEHGPGAVAGLPTYTKNCCNRSMCYIEVQGLTRTTVPARCVADSIMYVPFVFAYVQARVDYCDRLPELACPAVFSIAVGGF